MPTSYSVSERGVVYSKPHSKSLSELQWNAVLLALDATVHCLPASIAER